jgi:hypothetical protein
MCNPHSSSYTSRKFARTGVPPHSLSTANCQEQERLAGRVRTRSVAFDERVKVYAHIHVNDISQQSIARAWYTQEELLSIKTEVYEIANASHHSSSWHSKTQKKRAPINGLFNLRAWYPPFQLMKGLYRLYIERWLIPVLEQHNLTLHRTLI